MHLLRLVAASSRQQTTEKGHSCQGSLDSLSNFQSSATHTHFKSHFDWISQRATWEYTHLHFTVPLDAEQQMNINSAISHYQAGIIMMNAILYWMSLQGRGKAKRIRYCLSVNTESREISASRGKGRRGWRKTALRSWPEWRLIWNNAHCSHICKRE